MTLGVRFPRCGLAPLAFFAVVCFGWPGAARAATTFTVTTNADSGPGSLRDAISSSNATPGSNTIDFSIGTGATTIAPLTALPAISNPVFIDGTSQPGFSGLPLIRLDGANVANGTGLMITAGSSNVEALEITRWATAGIDLNGLGSNLVKSDQIGTNGAVALGNGDGVLVDNSSSMNTIQSSIVSGNIDGIHITGTGTTGNVVVSNNIGTTRPGSAALPNTTDGVLIGAGASSNTVGGTASASRNLISGNGTGVDITGSGTSSNVVEGNYVGTNAAGTAGLANTGDGVLVEGGATNNTVGGTAAGSRNVISGNGNAGMALSFPGTSGNLVEGNYIGTNAARTAAIGNVTGVSVLDGATSNTVGGTTAAARNLISGNGDGVDLFGGADGSTTGNTVEGDYVGTNPVGTAALPNTNDGVSIGAGAYGNTIGGTAPGSRDLISGNGFNGVNVFVGCALGSLAGRPRTPTTTLSPNVIEGDFIGTNVSGTTALANSNDGVFVGQCAFATTIGGTTAAARNLISANLVNGVEVNQASSTLVEGNYIGTTVTGASALANGADGVLFGSASGNTIGGTVAGAGNLISANTTNGVELMFSAGSNTLAGNWIGTNAARTAALANGGDGIHVASGANGNTIGGTTALARNLISGNTGNGIVLTDSGTSSNVLEGNYIGTQPAGATALPNGGDGVLIEGGATTNTVGGTTAGSRDVISGNTGDGVVITGGGTNTNLLEGNYIGTTASGSAALRNAGPDGVIVKSAARYNTIGGATGAKGNTIAFGGSGVEVNGATTVGDSVLRNSIFANTTGIALTAGGNNSEPAPVITSVMTGGGSTTVSGAAPSGTERIEVFVNPNCSDPEGKKFIGVVTISTGNWSLTVPALAAGQGITATGTHYPGSNTSQFSGCSTS